MGGRKMTFVRFKKTYEDINFSFKTGEFVELSPKSAAQLEREGIIEIIPVKEIKKLFFVRDDTYPIQNNDGRYRRIKETVTEEIIKKHLRGEITIGSYQINPKDDTVKWGCFDIDAEHVEESKRKTYEIRKKLIQKGIPYESILMEKSGSPGSYHVWLVISSRIKASTVKTFMESIRDEIDSNIEVFPKQESAGVDNIGNLVKLPFGYHQKTKVWSEIGIATSSDRMIEGFDVLKHVKRCTIPKIKRKSGKKEIKEQKELRPCFKKAIEEGWSLHGPGGDWFRLALVNELIANNYTDEQIHDVFKSQDNYNYDTTQAKIEYSRKHYGNSFQCSTIWEKSEKIVKNFCESCNLKKKSGGFLLPHPQKRREEIKQKEAMREAITMSLPPTPEHIQQMLCDDGLLFMIKRELDKYHTGDDYEKLTGFLLTLSIFLPEKQFILLTGNPSSGKSHMAKTITKWIPQDRIAIRTGVSYAAWYRSEEIMNCDVIYLKEFTSQGENEQVRLLYSEDGGLLVEVSVHINGGWTTEVIKVPPKLFITTTTNVDIDSQLMHRSWLISPDESNEQTNRILAFKVMQGVNKIKEIFGETHSNSECIFDYLYREITTVDDILVPFRNALHQIIKRVPALRLRRDFDKLLVLTKLSALLHSKQRSNIEKNGKKYLIATLTDIWYALVISWRILEATIKGSDKRVVEVAKILSKETHPLTATEIAEKMGISTKYAFQIIYSMEKNDYISVNREEKPYKIYPQDLDKILKTVKEPTPIDIIIHAADAVKYYDFLSRDLESLIINTLLEGIKAVHPITGERVRISHEEVLELVGKKDDELKNKLMEMNNNSKQYQGESANAENKPLEEKKKNHEYQQQHNVIPSGGGGNDREKEKDNSSFDKRSSEVFCGWSNRKGESANAENKLLEEKKKNQGGDDVVPRVPKTLIKRKPLKDQSKTDPRAFDEEFQEKQVRDAKRGGELERRKK